MSFSLDGRRLHFVFVACGTRGDVQPLAVLATAASERGHRVHLATHAAHAAWLDGPLQRSGVSFLKLSCLPAAVWRTASEDWTDQRAAREELLRAVCSCFENAEQPALLACNLFALESWHLAEALCIPCCVAQAYMLPTAPPRGLDRMFGEARLPEIEHWEWALYSERWSSWRQRLGLPPLSCNATSTLLLYGFSESVLPRPGYWPHRIHTTGYWPAPDGWESFTPSPELSAFLSCASTQPLACISFGSMASLGVAAIPYPSALLECLSQALVKAQMRAVLLIESDSQLAHAVVASVANSPHFCPVCGSVPLPWLLPRCTCVLHHGGSGTCAAALSAGVPQVICPFLFDQSRWGELLQHLGCAATVNATAILQACDDASIRDAALLIEHALRSATGQSGADMQRSAQNMRHCLLAEDGAAVALRLMESEAAARAERGASCSDLATRARVLLLA